jgi:hypothetical protein
MWFEEKETDYILGFSGVYVTPEDAMIFKLGCPATDYYMDMPGVKEYA